LVDADGVVAGQGKAGDLRDVLPLEAEARRAVVADVDLEGPGVAQLEAKSDPVARCGADDGQHAMLELRVLEVGPWRPRVRPDGDARGRDGIPPGAEVGQACSIGLAGSAISGETVEGVAGVGDLH